MMVSPTMKIEIEQIMARSFDKGGDLTLREFDHVSHPILLGAHRYTTASGGIVRSAEGLSHMASAAAKSCVYRVLTQRQEGRFTYGS